MLRMQRLVLKLNLPGPAVISTKTAGAHSEILGVPFKGLGLYGLRFRVLGLGFRV